MLWLLKGVAVLWLLQVTLFVVGISLFPSPSSRERRLGQREEEPAASNVASKRAA